MTVLDYNMPHFPEEIEYSDKYLDDFYEYRHVLLPKVVYKKMPRGRLLTETEWRQLGFAYKNSAVERVGPLRNPQTGTVYFAVSTSNWNRSEYWKSTAWMERPWVLKLCFVRRLKFIRGLNWRDSS